MSSKYWAVLALDKSDSTSLRANTRAAHLEWARKASLALAGPLVRESGAYGSLIIFHATEEETKAELKNDPYALAGLFEKVAIFECELNLPQVKTLGDNLYCIWCEFGEASYVEPTHQELLSTLGLKGLQADLISSNQQKCGMLVLVNWEIVDSLEQPVPSCFNVRRMKKVIENSFLKK